MTMDLPDGWTMGQDASGRQYYVNHNTKETTWEVRQFVGYKDRAFTTVVVVAQQYK